MNRNLFLRCPKVANPRTKEMACGEGLLASSAQNGTKVKGCICKGEAGGLSVVPAFKSQRQEKWGFKAHLYYVMSLGQM